MNRYPLQPRPRRWEARLNPTLIRWLRPLRRFKARTEQQLTQITVHGDEHVRAALKSGHGVLITPNHPTHADAYAMFHAADVVGSPFYFMSAWQIFEMQNRLGRCILQMHGCFSVDRDAADKHAFRTATDLLRSAPYPLVIFPEGEVYHINDRITPFRDGAAAIALSALRKAERPISIIPCALRYTYLKDPTTQLLSLMAQLEAHIHWRPLTEFPLPQRIYRLAQAIIALKEIEYLDQTNTGTLPQRINLLSDSVLRTLESTYGLPSPPGVNEQAFSAIPVRVKEVRAAALKKLADLQEQTPPPADLEQQRASIARDLDDVFLVVQAYSYPGDYVDENPTVERLAETLDKLEEDLLGRYTASIRAPRKAAVTFGPAVELDAVSRMPAADLTSRLETAVQDLLNAPR